PALLLAGEYVLNTSLVKAISGPEMDLDRIRSLLDDASRREIMLDTEGIAFAFQQSVERLAASLAVSPDDAARLEHLAEAVALAEDSPFDVTLWTVQNAIYDLRRDYSGTVRARAAAGDPAAEEWLAAFRKVAGAVRVAVE
ncbi:MAG: glycoside hydrolase, partial [Gemmatimonadota bacterium]